MIHFDKLSASLRHSSVTVPYTFVVLLCLLLSSCGLVPNATNSQPTQQQQAMANLQPVNFKTTADEQTPTMPEAQIITFPDMVTPQTLAVVDKLPGGQHFKLKLVVAKKPSSQQDAELEAVEADEADDNEDKDDAEEGDDEDDAFLVQAQKSKPKYTRNDRVFIPETGAFNLTFQAGGDYQVLDGDARDGNATVQMPREVLAAYMKVRGKFSRDAHKQFPAITRKLSYADPLYYVKQDLTREKKRHGKQTWLSLGNRALPIPTDWRSADGDKYILKLNNQGVTRVVMRWYPTKGNAVVTYPPGLNLIGPAGGVVELPGIGKLEIPAGAIATPTVVRMTQVLNAPEIVGMVNWKVQRQEDYISPVVKIEPMGLVLHQPAIIYLKTFMERVGNNHPAIISWSITLDTQDWRMLEKYAPNLGLDIAGWTGNEPAELEQFGIVAKFFPTRISPDEGLRNIIESESPNSTGFHTQQVVAKNFYVIYAGTGTATQDAQKIGTAAQVAYDYYSQLMGQIQEPGVVIKMPPEWFSPRKGLSPKIPIYMTADIPITQINIKGIGKFFSGTPITGAVNIYLDNGSGSNGGATLDQTAHEVWHAFQFAYFTHRDLNKTKYDGWFLEGSAEHMGALVSNQILHYPMTNMNYQNSLDIGQFLLAVPLHKRMAEASGDVADPRGYSTTSFFSFLSHPTVNPTQEVFLARLNYLYAQQVITGNTNPLQILKTQLSSPAQTFADYAVHAYTRQKFHLYTPEKIKNLTYQINKTDVTNLWTIIEPANSTAPQSVLTVGNVRCLAAQYYQVKNVNKRVVTISVESAGSPPTLKYGLIRYKDTAFSNISTIDTANSGNFLFASHTIGSIAIVVANGDMDCTQVSTKFNLKITYKKPSLHAIAPTSIPQGNAPVEITIDGDGLQFVTKARLNPISGGEALIIPASANEEGTQVKLNLQPSQVGTYKLAGLLCEEGDTGEDTAGFGIQQIPNEPGPICETTNELDLTITPAQQLILLDPNPFTLFTDSNITVTGQGMDMATPANNKLILTHTTFGDVFELSPSGPIGTDTNGNNIMSTSFTQNHAEIPTGLYKAKLQLCRGTACTTSNEVDFNVRSPDIPSVKPKVDPPTTALRQGREVRITGEGFYPPATVKLTHTNGSVTTLSATGTLGELNFTPAYTLPTGTYTLKVCTAYQCSDAITVTIAPWRAQVSLVDSAPVLFANGIQTATLSFKVSGLPPNTSKSFIIKMLGNRKGNFYCESCGFYVHPTSNITVTKPNGSFNLRYLVPTANIEPFDYLGPAGQEWRDPRHYDQIHIESSDSLGSPYVAFPEPDSDIEQARIYWVYTYGGTLQIPTYVPANGQPNTFTIHNVTDRLGRPVPDGTTVYIANPYWGHFVNQAGGNATAYAVNGGSAQVIYSNTQIGGWGYVPTGEHASEGLHLRATLGTTYGTNDSRSWLYPQVEYRFFTYNLP